MLVPLSAASMTYGASSRDLSTRSVSSARRRTACTSPFTRTATSSPCNARFIASRPARLTVIELFPALASSGTKPFVGLRKVTVSFPVMSSDAAMPDAISSGGKCAAYTTVVLGLKPREYMGRRDTARAAGGE
eukprot:scaffold3649_cov30-Tisochrysis_lutea.AAC.6